MYTYEPRTTLLALQNLVTNPCNILSQIHLQPLCLKYVLGKDVLFQIHKVFNIPWKNFPATFESTESGAYFYL